MAIKFLNDQLFPSDIFLVDVSAGRVGINTLLPRTALEVVGTLRVWSGSNTHTYVETSSGSNLGSIQGKKNSDNAVKALALNPLGGNVGINLGAGIIPSEALQVQGSAKIQADSNNFLKITTSQAVTTFANTGNGIVSPSMSFSTGGTTRLTILGFNGNVGIGIAVPDAKLHVKASNSGATTQSGTLIIEAGSAPSIQLLSANTQTQSIKFGDPQDGDAGAIAYSHASNEMKFRTNGGDRVTIENAGNVGIGTTDPKAKLDVAGGVKVANDTDTAVADKAGTLRYRFLPSSPKSQSKVDMCMQTGPSSYAWVNIVTNTWSN